MNEVVRTILDHTSIRKFNNEKITEEQVRIILESAMRGATAGNMMLYSIIEIRSKDTLEKLSKSCDEQRFIGDAEIALLFVVDSYKWYRFFKSRGVLDQYTDFKGPQISDFLLGMEDAMIAAQNAVVAAESLGIGACYIGDIMENIEYHKKLFNLPEYTMPASLVVLGNFDHKPELRPRFAKRHVVFKERYPDIEDEFIDEMFASKEINEKDFAMKFYERKMIAPFSKEMIRSIELYMKDWKK